MSMSMADVVVNQWTVLGVMYHACYVCIPGRDPVIKYPSPTKYDM